MHILKLVVQGISSLCAHFEDVDCVVMASNCEVLTIGGITHGLTPFSRSQEGCDLFGEIGVVEDGDVSLIVAHSDVFVNFRVSDRSALLVSRELT